MQLTNDRCNTPLSNNNAFSTYNHRTRDPSYHYLREIYRKIKHETIKLCVRKLFNGGLDEFPILCFWLIEQPSNFSHNGVCLLEKSSNIPHKMKDQNSG